MFVLFANYNKLEGMNVATTEELTVPITIMRCQFFSNGNWSQRPKGNVPPLAK
jgi:hypothetical protein